MPGVPGHAPSSRMKRGGSAGNPSAATSCSHPVHTETKTSESERGDHQSTEPAPLSGSQNHQQSPDLTHHKDQSPPESRQEDQTPAAEHQSPVKSLQEDQHQAERHRSPEEEDQDPAVVLEKNRNPVKGDQSLSGKEENDQSFSGKDEKDLSPSEKDRKEQSLSKKEENDQSLLEKDEKDQNLSDKDEKDQNLSDKHEKDQNLVEKDDKDQSLSEKDDKNLILSGKEEKDQSLLEKDEKDQSLLEKEEKDKILLDREEKDLDLSETHEKDQNLLETHVKDLSISEKEEKDPSLSEKEEKDPSLSEKEEKDPSLSEKEEKDQRLSKKEEKDQSLLEKDDKNQGESEEDQGLSEKNKKDQSLSEKDEKDQSSSEKDAKEQSLSEKEKKDRSLLEKDVEGHSESEDQSPSQKDENVPILLEKDEKDQSPSEIDQRDHQKHRNLQERLPKDQNPEANHQNPVEQDRSPAEKDKKDVNPAETHQSPSDKHLNPLQKKQNPAKKHQKDQMHQTLAEKNQKSQIPSGKKRNDQKVQIPTKKPHGPLGNDQIPAERHQNDQSHAKKHKTDQKNQSHTEKPQSSVRKHQNRAKKQTKDQRAAEKSQSPAEERQTQEKPDQEDRTEPGEAQDPGESRLSIDEPEGPLPAEPSQTKLEPHSAQQQHLEESTLTEEPIPRQQHPLTPDKVNQDPPKPVPLFTDQIEPGISPQPHNETDKEPKLGRDQEVEQQNVPFEPPVGELDEVDRGTEPEQQPESSLDHQNQEEHPPTVQKETPPGDQGNPPSPRTQGSTPAPLAPPLTMQPRPVTPGPGEPKLCGFLQKQGGPLRAWKQRWFTYEEKKNQLFYYRMPQDVMPLGRVELSGATFTYPLKGEKGTFHIRTPERTFILKAVNQDLMLYWLQQLQVKRWQHRQTCTDLTHNNNNTTDDFLPVLQSPVGLVGEEAANVPSQRGPLAGVSIKHPLIHIQNSVHSLRKSFLQDGQQSVFHVDAPPWIPPTSAEANTTMTSSRRPSEPPTPPALLPLADPAGRESPVESCDSPSLFDSFRRRSKTPSTSTVSRRKDPQSSTSRLQQEKQMLVEEVKAQKELVWILHRALEASQLEKRSCTEFLSMEDEQDRLELLRHKERQAADLRARLQEAESEGEVARRGVAERDVQLAELQQNVRTLTEKNQAKQEVILKLSNQVSECLSERRQSTSSRTDSPDSLNLRQLQQEVENLKDDIEAYKNQNKFLNSEIFQLTKLWRTSSEQAKNLMVKCAYLEATNCQVESRYLGVLQKLQETKTLDPVHQEAVKKMIKDALKEEMKSTTKLRPDRDYDEYGFKIVPDYEVEDIKLLAKIQALEIRSHNLLHQDAVEHPLLSRWAQYLAGRSDQDLCSSPELKVLVRGGIPLVYRPRVWRWMIWARTRNIREQHPQLYQELCEKSRTSPHSASRQIQLDLHRTLTSNQNFSPSSPALQQLSRILLAFSWRDPAIGYCQGLNRLAAVALLVLQNEEDAFWCLVAVVETIMPQDYYTKSLVASQADQRVLKDLLMEKLPRLAAHFEELHIDVSLVTFNWFMVVFVESLPSDILLPLWDAFLYEGTKVMFRYALALFKYKEDDILKFNDSVEVYQYLRFFTKTISDSRRLSSIAFVDMNPFPGRLLRNRRALHLERLQGELFELEEQQKAFLTPRARRKDKDVDTLASEDDDEL